MILRDIIIGAAHCDNQHVPGNSDHKAGRKLLCRGGGDGTEAHFSNPPLPLLGRRAGRGVWAGGALPAVPGGGGGPTPTYMATTHGYYAYVGEHFFVKKIFPGQNLCSGAFGGNIRPYTKQKAQHRSPFLESPPPLLRRAPMPSPPAKQFSGRPCSDKPTLHATVYMKRACFGS